MQLFNESKTFYPFHCQELRRQRQQMMNRAQPPVATGSAKTTQVSTTTPNKAIKKSRVSEGEGDSTKRGLFDTQERESPWEPKTATGSPEEQQGLPPGLGQTGETPEMTEEMSILRDLYYKTLEEKKSLEVEVAKLEEKIQSLTIHHEDGQGEPQSQPTAIPSSDDAARKRLQRICARNSCGTHGYDKEFAP